MLYLFYIVVGMLMTQFVSAYLTLAIAITLAIIDTSKKIISISLLVGLLIGCYHHYQLNHLILPKQYVAKNLVVVGKIISIPESQPLLERFVFKVSRLNIKTRLSWYGKHPALNVGEKWRLHIRLKPVHGFKNPGGFDYKVWLQQQGIAATGYVRQKAANKKLLSAQQASWLYFRQVIQNKIQNQIKSPEIASILAALSVGSRALMQSQTWQVFQRTGTSHLIAISGLHVGLIAAIAYFLFFKLFGLVPRLYLYVPGQRIAAALSIAVIVCYGFLAGFSYPTQRAVIMIGVVMLFTCFDLLSTLMQRIVFSFFIITLIHPLALTSASFWLSFAAVAWIAFAACQQPCNKFKQWLWLQFVIFLGLMPLTLYFFQKLSLVMFVSNAIAIPWVSFIIVPLCFFACFISLFSNTLSILVFKFAALCLKPLWWYLTWLSHWSWASWLHPIAFTTLIATVFAVIILLLPLKLQWRSLGLIAALPLFLPLILRPKIGEASLTVLDVGQGLSAVIETAQHNLLFDAGPRSALGFDAGEVVVLPYLRHQHINHLHKIIISHGDNDHIGGVWAVKKHYPKTRVLTSVPYRFYDGLAQHCQAGQHWQWDGVNFEILYPPVQRHYEGNNSSCVLRVSTRHQSVLLTGDIEKAAEKLLVTQHIKAATVLVVPHHGSKTSSSGAFLAKVHPKIAVISSGFLNRFHFPSKQVLQRYQAIGSKILNTADVGYVHLHLN